MWRSENSLQVLVLAFHHVDPRDCQPQWYVSSPTEPSPRVVVCGFFLSNKIILLAQILQKVNIEVNHHDPFHSYTCKPHLHSSPTQSTGCGEYGLMKIAGPHLL